jgi:FKBP-type peptidyl-prolyl cis-trans isomerase
LLPPPENLPVEVPDSFKSEKDRQSYALGSFFATREKNSANASNAPLPNVDEMVAGLTDVLTGGKSVDYGVGAQLAVQIRRAEVDIDPAVLAQAVRDVMTSQPPKLTTQQEQMVMQRIQSDLRQRAETKRKAEAAKNMEAATEFLTKNAKAEGVKQSASGLQYTIEKEGEGKSAAEGDLAMLNYKAMLIDGTVFEKSPDTGPMRKPVRTLPKGLQEGLAMLKFGGKGKFWIPPALGHGEMGRPPQVKSNAVLIYEVELVSAEPLPRQPATSTTGRQPITAVTPPITVEIPPKPGDKPAEAPKPNTPKPPDTPKPPAPPPAPPATPEKK